MRPLQILAVATTIEMCLAAALLALAGLGGAWSPWLDLINSMAPLIVLLGVAGLAAAFVVLPRDLRRTRAVCLCAAALATAYGGLMTAPELAQRLLPERAASGRPYHLVTANVFSTNDSPFSAARSVALRGADAVVVEEADGTIQRARGVLVAVYPFVTSCSDAGVDIWLKTPILAQGCGLPTRPGTYYSWGQGFAWARTLGPDGKPITIVGVHFGRPYPPERQRVEQDALPIGLKPLAGDRTLLVGDFNMAPWSFAMHRLDRSLSPLRRRTRWQATYPARVNLTHAVWNFPVLPIDHIYAGSAWSSFKTRRFRVPNSDHFALDTQAVLGP